MRFNTLYNYKRYKMNVINPYFAPPLMGFEALIAPIDFDKFSQQVDIHTVFSNYYYANSTAVYIYAFTNTIATLSLNALSGISYRWGETLSGVNAVYDIAEGSSGTAFTSGSTGRFVIVCAQSGFITNVPATPVGAHWIYSPSSYKIPFCRNNTYLQWVHVERKTAITAIQLDTFSGCTNLTGILTLPNTVTEIGSFAFYNCNKLTGTLSLPSSLTLIGAGAFQNCSGITQVSIPGSVSSLVSTFNGCTGLTSVTIPYGVTQLSGTFHGCTGLSGTIVIPDSVTQINDADTFRGCTNITGIQLSANLTYLGNQTFLFCSNLVLNGINLPSTLQTIAYGAFHGCTKLTGTVVIPASITSIAADVFYNTKINRIDCLKMTAPSVSSGFGTNINSPIPLHVKAGATGYTGNPWTNTAIFSSIITDL